MWASGLRDLLMSVAPWPPRASATQVGIADCKIQPPAAVLRLSTKSGRGPGQPSWRILFSSKGIK
jgi:hypothetical protein